MKEIQMASPSAVRQVLQARGLAAKKNWGQNFLTDGAVAESIAAQVPPGNLLYEIGPGLGALSQFLLPRTGRLALVEIDPALAAWLQQLFAEESADQRVEILQGDALELDFDAHAQQRGFANYVICGNLPYYITTPLLKHFLCQQNWGQMVFLVQREAAQRMAAGPGNKDYGLLNLMIEYYAELDLLFNVADSAFHPRPEVQSSLIRFRRRPAPAITVRDARLLFATINAALSQRRKTLANALKNSGLAPGVDWPALLRTVAIDGQRRGETLHLEEFGALCDALWQQLHP